MKTLTFFSEKGGMGKTTFSVLMASWLAYHEGRKVYVIDFDYPGYQMMNMRNRDLQILKAGGNQLSVLSAGNDFYTIGKVKGNYQGYTRGELATIAENIVRLRGSGDGYVILDFPGRFMQNDPVYHLMRLELLDLVVFPIDTDIQSITSALNVNALLKDPSKFPSGKDQQVLLMWNRETANERAGRRDWYATYDSLFSRMRLPVAGVRMRNIEILRRDPPTFGFVRNTVCWPEANVARRCPYVGDLFREILMRLDGEWTPEAAETVYGKDGQHA